VIVVGIILYQSIIPWLTKGQSTTSQAKYRTGFVLPNKLNRTRLQHHEHEFGDYSENNEYAEKLKKLKKEWNEINRGIDESLVKYRYYENKAFQRQFESLFESWYDDLRRIDEKLENGKIIKQGARVVSWSAGVATGGLSAIVSIPFKIIHSVYLKELKCEVEAKRFNLSDVYYSEHTRNLTSSFSGLHDYILSRKNWKMELLSRISLSDVKDLGKLLGNIALKTEKLHEVVYEDFLDVPYYSIKERLGDVVPSVFDFVEDLGDLLLAILL